jgi:hypothetical protein
MCYHKYFLVLLLARIIDSNSRKWQNDDNVDDADNETIFIPMLARWWRMDEERGRGR